MANKNQKPVKEVETKKVETKKAAKKTSVKKAPKKETKKEVKKVVVEEEMANIMEDEKESKKVNHETLKFIGNAIFWIVFAVLAFIWITDFVKVTREEEPVFCIKNKVHTFDDGTVNECVGLGYKVYTYNRDSFDKGVQFGPFFTKMKDGK